MEVGAEAVGVTATETGVGGVGFGECVVCAR